MNKTLVYVLVLAAMLPATGVSAQESFFTHLKSHVPEKIVLACEWDSVITHKDDTSWDAELTVIGADSTVDWETEVTVRGKFRRSRCTFPPLELNLKKRELRNRGMQEYDKLKLVTHCNAANADPADLFEELLIYKLYNILTPYSYDVLLLHVDYLYPSGKAYKANAPALLLEPTSEITARLRGTELEMYGVSEDSLNADSYCTTSLFQFMIGNFDWDPGLQRNVKMIGSPGDYHLVPYDFDFSAIVYPAYGRMPSEFGIKDFRDRIFLGDMHLQSMTPVIRHFLDKKKEILNYVNDFDLLSKSRRKEISAYLMQFFDYIAQPKLDLQKNTILLYKEK